MKHILMVLTLLAAIWVPSLLLLALRPVPEELIYPFFVTILGSIGGAAYWIFKHW